MGGQRFLCCSFFVRRGKRTELRFVEKQRNMMRLMMIMAAGIVALLISMQVNAQEAPSKLYLGVSTGMENQTGLIGGHVEVPLTNRISILGGMGLSVWGGKLSAEGRYYFNDCSSGWAVGAGLIHSTGFKGYDVSITGGTQRPANMRLLPVNNVFGSVYHFWQLGKGRNKFYVQGGYSARLSDKYYEFKDVYKPTSQEQRFMRSLSPGGLMIAAGFTFSLAH
jgi:hypothetical protein